MAWGIKYKIKWEQKVPDNTYKSGHVALLGRSNVGKSTLLNELLQFKLSIVSPKPQTTRHAILGIAHGDYYQVAFLDTPGMMRRPEHQLDRRMVAAMHHALEQADLLVLVVDPRMPGDIEERFIEELKRQQKPVLLVVNKVDTIAKPRLLPILEDYERRFTFNEMVPVSARKRDGLDRVLELIVKHLPEGAPLYSSEELTDRTERFLVSEIIREKVYLLYQDEVPYATTVDIEDFIEESPDHGGKDFISAVVYVERPTQRGILIGGGGQALKTVGMDARKDIEALLERPVHLELWVKSRTHWRHSASFLQEMGYDSGLPMV